MILEYEISGDEISYFENGVKWTSETYTGFVKPWYKLKNAPNWLGLEQALRYSPMFAKAFTMAKQDLSISVGFNFFVATLQNGKRGDASESALSFAFSQLGITWSEQETADFNTLLAEYNFTIRLT